LGSGPVAFTQSGDNPAFFFTNNFELEHVGKKYFSKNAAR
jgi:hypothetical protein